MNSRLVKESLRKFSEVLSFNYPAVGWYYSSEEMEKSFIFRKDKWVCMFMYLKMMMNKNKKIRFSEDNYKACAGPAGYFGFTELEDDGGVFLAEVERFCKDIEISKAYSKWSATLIHPPKGKYLYMEKLENIDDSREIEVANLFPASITNLAKLVTLSSYDRMANTDNVYNGPQNLNQLLSYKTNGKGRFKLTPEKEVHEKELQWKIQSQSCR